nr:hypothetical protein GCM10020185_14190 [Pseudomonas brassicacearum subsp. brassicacearum]
MMFPALKGLPLHRVMMRTVTEFLDDEMSTYASALAYQMLFFAVSFHSLFLIALIGFLHLPDFFSLAAPAIGAGAAAPRPWSRSTR